MHIKEAVGRTNNAIRQWSKEHDRLTVAIDGYTGVGKTTLLEKLANLNEHILPVNRDDFQLSRTVVKKLIQRVKDRSRVFELQMCDIKKIGELVHAFRAGKKNFRTKVYNSKSGEIDIPKSFDLSKKILVMEGVFSLHPKLTDRLWNKRIYLKGNIKEIDKRRIKREKARWGKDYFSETHPDSYFKQVTKAFKRYQKSHRPEERADLVLKI